MLTFLATFAAIYLVLHASTRVIPWHRIPEPLRSWRLALAVAGAALATLALNLPSLALGIVVVLLAGCWLHELAVLMETGDDAFPGRHDKLLWLGLFVILPPVGALLFRARRGWNWDVVRERVETIRRNLA